MDYHVFPDWDNSILNVSATMQDYLGVTNDIPKLRPLQSALSRGYKNVVLVVVDGMGMSILDRHLSKSFLRSHVAQTVTGVFPSTTTNATTSLMSATYPAQHGWFAWAMNFADVNQTVMLFKNADYYTGEPMAMDDFARTRLPYINFYADANIDAYTLMPRQIQMKPNAGDIGYFDNTRDMFHQLDTLCAAGGQKFVYTYHCDLDSTMHKYGPSSRQTKKMAKSLDRGFRKLAARNTDTLFVITADHGQIDVAGCVDIWRDADVMECLAQNISLDPRGAAFHIKSGMHDKFVAAMEKYKPDFALYPTDDLINKNIFGPFAKNRNREFLGDFIAIGTGTNKILSMAPGKENSSKTNAPYRGHHTGLTPEEMVLPLIII